MTELEKLEYAKTYIDQLANGINPLTGRPVADSDIVSNVRISRCLFFVSDVLRQTIENGGIHPVKSKKKKTPFSISHEQRSSFPYSDTPIPVSEIAKRINALTAQDNMRLLTPANINSWLMEIGVLTEMPDSKSRKNPSQQGSARGITVEMRHGRAEDYPVTVYNRAAQQFILDNLDAIIERQQPKKRY